MNKDELGSRLDRLAVAVSVTLIVAKAIYVAVIVSRLLAPA